MLQYCSSDAYGPINYTSMIIWYLTMGGTALLFFLSWIGHLRKKLKMQPTLPGIEDPAEMFGERMCRAALQWLWVGGGSITFIVISSLVHALFYLLKG